MLTLTLLGCSRLFTPDPVPAAEIEALLDVWTAEHADGVVLQVDEGALKDACQSDECSGWALTGVEHISYMNFQDGVKQDPTLQGLREHFDYVSYRVPITTRGDWKISLDWPNPIAQASEGRVVFESFDKGRLKMKIHHDAVHINAVNKGPECTPPLDAALPPGCVLSRPVSLRATLEIDLPAPSPGGG